MLSHDCADLSLSELTHMSPTAVFSVHQVRIFAPTGPEPRFHPPPPMFVSPWGGIETVKSQNCEDDRSYA